mmetsp:Transcript_2556/g.7029  ORF Transcript_2556/g.7029 Transcript_2556/m.7029 type:complete len:247 (+) Transcript_2556:708-1448(+)
MVVPSKTVLLVSCWPALVTGPPSSITISEIIGVLQLWLPPPSPNEGRVVPIGLWGLEDDQNGETANVLDTVRGLNSHEIFVEIKGKEQIPKVVSDSQVSSSYTFCLHTPPTTGQNDSSISNPLQFVPSHDEFRNPAHSPDVVSDSQVSSSYTFCLHTPPTTGQNDSSNSNPLQFVPSHDEFRNPAHSPDVVSDSQVSSSYTFCLHTPPTTGQNDSSTSKPLLFAVPKTGFQRILLFIYIYHSRWWN